MNKKRILGIPLIGIISIILVMSLGAGTIMGAFLFSRSQPASVHVVGGEVGIFYDEACNLPILETDIINFNNVVPGDRSDSVMFYVKNLGDFDVNVGFNYSGLDGLSVQRPDEATWIDLALAPSWDVFWTLAPGVSQGPLPLAVKASPGATRGDKPFVIGIKAEQTP